MCGTVQTAPAAKSSLGRHHSGHDQEIEMNWDVVQGNWKQLKGKAKEQWGKLTDDHLDVIAGKFDQLAGKIQETYGVTKDKAGERIKSFEEYDKDYKPS
jgi:uncharacterized protein YjbJ (UPF0337 family)